MGFVLTAVFGFIVWIVLWALGSKSFDAFMITALIIVGSFEKIVHVFKFLCLALLTYVVVLFAEVLITHLLSLRTKHETFFVVKPCVRQRRIL